jgi:hypothetical protein
MAHDLHSARDYCQNKTLLSTSQILPTICKLRAVSCCPYHCFRLEANHTSMETKSKEKKMAVPLYILVALPATIVADHIYKDSPCGNGCFVPANCVSLPFTPVRCENCNAEYEDTPGNECGWCKTGKMQL